jgi:hypothetical protein
MTCDQIADLLRIQRFNFGSELELQDGIESVLRRAGLDYVREFKIGLGSRVDFLVGDVGIEVKIGGSLQAATRQLHRYAGSDKIGSLILVSSRLFHNLFPESLRGKPLRVVNLINSAI